MGKQLDLPGLAPIADAELAQRRADQPLKPDAPQEPCDVGLFSDEAAQTDLMDLAHKRLQEWAAGANPRPVPRVHQNAERHAPEKHHDETT